MNKQESQNQISIIINGIRYDSVQLDEYAHFCSGCDFQENCKLSKACSNLIVLNGVFKKFNKIESTEWIKIERDKDDFATDECLDKIFQLFIEGNPIAIAYNGYGIDYDIIATSSNIQRWLADIHNLSMYTHYLPIKSLNHGTNSDNCETT